MISPLRIVFVAALAALACGGASPAEPDDPVTVQRIEIRSVQVEVGVTRPALVTARVTGTLGSGCDYLHSIEQNRQGNAVVVEIKRSHFTAGPCTMILKEFQQELGLAGGFSAGDYTLQVNGVSRTFSVS